MGEQKHTPTPWLSDAQVHSLNEKHGWFMYGDAQGDVSRAFAQDAIEMHERIRAAAPQLLAALDNLCKQLERDGIQSGSTYGPLCHAAAAALKLAGAA